MRAGAEGSGAGWCGPGRSGGGGSGGAERLIDGVRLGQAGQPQSLGGLRVELICADGCGLGAAGLGGLPGLHLLGDGGLLLAGAGEVLGVAERTGELLAGAFGLAQMAVAALGVARRRAGRGCRGGARADG